MKLRLFAIMLWPIIFLLAVQLLHIDSSNLERFGGGMLILVIAAIAMKMMEMATNDTPDNR